MYVIYVSSGFAPFRRGLLAGHRQRYHELQCAYLATLKYHGTVPGNNNHRYEQGGSKYLDPNIYTFPEFEDKMGYHGFVPSPGYFRELFLADHARRRPFMDKHMTATFPGRILKGDHSFKVRISTFAFLEEPFFTVFTLICYCIDD